MKIIKNINQMQNLIKKIKSKNKTVGFVPTMGYLHEGHLSLMRKARLETDVVVVSIFVNPTQFGPTEDYAKYPRDFDRDIKLSKKVGVDLLFHPEVKSMYRDDYYTYVEVEKLTQSLCGASRPGHFIGVTTVVTKLFNIVQPDIAYFGQKDAQQAYVVKKMVKDLNIPVKIRILPTIREEDGLAISSRNGYLNPEERKQARCLYQALKEARKLIKNKCGYNPGKIKKAMQKIVEKNNKAKIDYIEIVDCSNLEPIKKIKGKVLIALAVYIGNTRLVDNVIVSK